jgi:multidrug resistance efflux pump
MLTTVRVLLTLLVLAAAGFLSYDMASYYLYSPWTRDARIRADVVTVAPDVQGYITDLRVRNDQFVHKGDILFVIDQERYKLELAEAEATSSAQLATQQMLLQQLERRSKIISSRAISQEELDNTRRQSESAASSYRQSIAARDLAALNLRRTEVRAYVNGFVTNLNLAQGTYASPSKPVLALIDSDSYRVDAYFEETKIPQIKVGSPVDIRLLNGSPALQGKVETIARGITDYDNRDGPELLANVNPTFTWVRLAQRIPVRIRLTNVPEDVLISSGMTCTVTLKEGAEPHIGASFKRLMAAIWPTSGATASVSAPAPSTSSTHIANVKNSPATGGGAKTSAR